MSPHLRHFMHDHGCKVETLLWEKSWKLCWRVQNVWDTKDFWYWKLPDKTVCSDKSEFWCDTSWKKKANAQVKRNVFTTLQQCLQTLAESVKSHFGFNTGAQESRMCRTCNRTDHSWIAEKISQSGGSKIAFGTLEPSPKKPCWWHKTQGLFKHFRFEQHEFETLCCQFERNKKTAEHIPWVMDDFIIERSQP